MKLELLMLTLVFLVGNVSGMSTCKTVDLEMVKKKRIEAIRSQILSKLRLPKEPEEDQTEDTKNIPTTLVSLYNSTRELLKEQQTEAETVISTEQEEEEYFSKVLHKFNMINTENMKDKKSIEFHFNLTNIRQSIGNYQLLASAELRLLIKSPNIAGKQRVELYMGLGPSPEYLNTRFINGDLKDKWLSYDVTETLRTWLQGNETKQGFQLYVFCACDKDASDNTFKFSISGFSFGRGDTQGLELLAQQPPYILTMSIPQNVSNRLTSRKKRATDGKADTCTTQTETCCVRSLYIDFRKDLGWKWIHTPSGYHANYCMGSCTYIWNAENKYSQILALYKHHNPGASAQPCCVPQTLEPLPIIYYRGRQPQVEQLSNMIVKSCKCS